MSPKRARLRLFVVAFATSLVSIILFALQGYRNTGNFMRAVMSERSTTSIVVHFLSSVLGSLNIYTATRPFIFRKRIWLRENVVGLKQLKSLAMLASLKAEFALTPRGIMSWLVVLIAGQVPGALWAGSMTPIIKPIVKAGTIHIPKFTADSRAIWDSEFYSLPGELRVRYNIEVCLDVTSATTRVGSCPIPYLQSSILRSGSTATTMTGDMRKHSKIDSLGWSYHGPSYGVGSSPGLVAPKLTLEHVEIPAYSYTEAGYHSIVKCTKNTSSDYALSAKPQFHDQDGLNLWVVHGSLPNSPPGHPELYWTTDWGNRIKPSVLAWSAVVNQKATDKHMIAITAGEHYAVFNQTQCTVAFEPTTFNVFVNNVDRSIHVKPIAQEAPSVDIEPTGRLASDVMWSLNLLSRMTPSLYESALANTLLQNAAAMRARRDKFSVPVDEEELTLRSTEESFTAMIDDLLVAFSAAQLVLAQSSAPTAIGAQLPALRIGKEVYIVCCLALNLFLLFYVLEEAWRHDLWNRLPTFNPEKIESLVLDVTVEGKTKKDVLLRMSDAELEANDAAVDEKTGNEMLQANEEKGGEIDNLLTSADET